MLRRLRPVAIGAAGAGVVWGTVYFVQQQAAMTGAGAQRVHQSREWGFQTKLHVLNAATSYSPAARAKQYEKALESVVSPTTNLGTKSQDWLAGYGDLLRALGLALYEEGEIEKARAPLAASKTIPFGTDSLRAEASVALYRLTGDAGDLLLGGALQGSSADTAGDAVRAAVRARPDRDLETEQDARSWVPFYTEAAKVLISREAYTDALANLLALHRAIALPAKDDKLCYKAATGGYIGQLLWTLGREQDSILWLRHSESEAATGCKTPACRETLDLILSLLDRAERK